MLTKRDALRLTVSKDLAIEAQRLCDELGISLNITQAVKAMLTTGINSTQATLLANKGISNVQTTNTTNNIN
jgi:antitoxin component of RelBE/YafQ-DinJ toxin-antitoxin module